MSRAPAKIIAEVGCNHGGDFEKAKRMIRAAAECGADYVKFQKRDVEGARGRTESITRSDDHAFGPNEYEHRKALEFTIEQHGELKDYADSCGISYTCSAWDQVSVTQLEGLSVPWVKVPSAKNQEFLSWKFKAETDIHVSLGLTTAAERDHILRVAHTTRPYCLFYACVSAYPCDDGDSYLGELEYLRTRRNEVGFSGHHRGIALDVAAYVLGAAYIERHFTLDRTAKGTDHAASLEPAGLARLVRNIKSVASAWKTKPGGLPECEAGARRKLKGA